MSIRCLKSQAQADIPSNYFVAVETSLLIFVILKDHIVHKSIRPAHTDGGEDGHELRRVLALSSVAAGHVHGLVSSIRLGGALARPGRAAAHPGEAQRNPLRCVRVRQNAHTHRSHL